MSYLLKNDPLVALFETPITLDFMPTMKQVVELYSLLLFTAILLLFHSYN